jgi:Fe2+ transport system protein FeoA
MPLTDVGAAVDALYDKRSSWLEVSLAERAALLDEHVASIRRVAPRWAETGGEAWTAGVVPLLRNALLLARALRQGGSPRPAAMRTRADGHVVARVYPSNTMERLLSMGVVAEVWIEKAKPKPASQGSTSTAEGRVCLVLGGGDGTSTALSVLYKLFVANEVVLLAMPSANEALADALAPLVSRGWLEIVHGVDAARHAAANPKIGSLHVTGADRAYDAIVWRGASIAEHRDKTRDGASSDDEPFTVESGRIAPVIAVPGPWSHTDVRWQARHVASVMSQSSSRDAAVVVVARQWLQKDLFLSALREELRKIPPLEAWTFLPDAGTDAVATEALGGVVAVVQLDAPDYHGASVPRLLEAAVKLANEPRWGSRRCCLLVHPATEDAHAAALGKALEELRHATIGVNVWPGVLHGLADAWLFDHAEKHVVRAPFRIRPKPPWFYDNRNRAEIGRRLVDFEAAPSWGGLARAALATMRG